MLLSDFPQEIIEQLTEFLSFKDKQTCSLVCKSWKGVFQDSLYSDLVVCEQLLEDLVKPPKNYQLPCLKTRLLVRCLETHHLAIAANEDLFALQKTFPSIKYLYLGAASITPGNFGLTPDWNIWRSLTELHICFWETSIPNIENELVKIMLCLPLLRRLQLTNRPKKDIKVSFSFDDFEIIHSHLKHLGYLELRLNILSLSQTDVERMPRVSPATKMGSLNIRSRNTDHRWLCYFAHKYPNLRKLDFTASNIQPESDEKRSDTIALFQQVPLPFQRLSNLGFQYRNLDENTFLLFWDIMHFHNVPLKHLSIDVKMRYGTSHPNNPCDIPKYIAEVCLLEYSKTIETLRLDCPSPYSTRDKFADIKGTLYNLVELSMKASASWEIDTLLCAAPSLRTIKLHLCDIKLKGELYNSNRFGLQSFILSQATITSDALRFLSFHCRSLDELGLHDSSVPGNFTTPGCQFIDMAYTRLEKLRMSDTSFIIQDNKRCKENLDITLITRPVDDIPPKQVYNPNVLPVFASDPPASVYYNWFYTNGNSEMCKVSLTDGFHVKRFVSDYEENIRNTTMTGFDAKKKKDGMIVYTTAVFLDYEDYEAYEDDD